MARLIIERTGAQSRVYELKDGSPVHIGRAASNDVTLPHSSISRSHARIDGGLDRWLITDLHSANGVVVNGARVERTELKNGDVIGLGDINLRFENMTTGTVVAKASPNSPRTSRKSWIARASQNFWTVPRPRRPSGGRSTSLIRRAASSFSSAKTVFFPCFTKSAARWATKPPLKT